MEFLSTVSRENSHHLHDADCQKADSDERPICDCGVKHKSEWDLEQCKEEIRFRKRVFTPPFRLVLAGGSGSGKSTWLMKFVEFCSYMFKSVTVFYQLLSPDLTELINNSKTISLKQGIPSQEDVDDLDGAEHTLWIIEDAMSEIGVSKTMAQPLTRVSSHCSLSVCLTLQNLFDKGPQIRTITLSATHLILFRSIRHQTIHLE